MLQTIGSLALMATSSCAFVAPKLTISPSAMGASNSFSTRAAVSSLRMATDEPLGVGVIGCGRIGDVSTLSS